tara:strand:+ start:279 stop:722 length:444 start_codon:yes stop_codon:yes gene_type:complete
MKYLSGDFLAEYSRALKEYKKEQDALDSKWVKIIDEIVEEEVERLDDVLPINFKEGSKVIDTNGNVGTVVNSPVVLNVYEDEEYYGKKYGPNKFFAVKNDSDEEAVTCEGMLRMISVEVEASDIEKDWGCDTEFASYYEDELKLHED